MSPDLAGRTALVTGASRGLGREIAGGLAAAGASVIGMARDATALDEVVAVFGGRPAPAGQRGGGDELAALEDPRRLAARW